MTQGNPNQTRGGNPLNTGQFSSDGSRRAETPLEGTALPYSDRSGETIQTETFSGTNGDSFSAAQLRDCVTTGTKFLRADFTEARLRGTWGHNTTFEQCDAHRMEIGGDCPDFSGEESVWRQNDMQDAYMDGLLLRGATVEENDFNASTLAECSWRDSTATGNDFNLCRFDRFEADRPRWDANSFEHAGFYGSSFRNGTMTNSTLDYCQMTRVGMQGTDLTGSSMKKAHVIASNFTGATFTETSCEGTKFDRCDFSGADLSTITTDGETNFDNCTVDNKTKMPSGWIRRNGILTKKKG